VPTGPLGRDPLRDSGDGDGEAHRDAAPDTLPFSAHIEGPRRLDAEALGTLTERLVAHRDGLIVAGPDDDPKLPQALAALARASGYPILADPLSGLRAGSHDRSLVVARGDQLLRPGPWIDAHRPSLVLRTGAMPTSKPIVELLRVARPELLVVDGDGGWREAALLPATFVHAAPAPLAVELARSLAARGVDRSADAWAADWLTADRAAAATMTSWLDGLHEPFEGAPYPALASALPDGATLWVGSSMPVRDLDAWFPSTGRALRLLANRGVNGIDGVVSTALGSAAVATGPVALVVGDLSFLHDLDALVTARLHGLALTVVLVDNDGGGIFSFLPQATANAPEAGLPAHFEELFGTPHGIDPGPIVAALGAEHRPVDEASLAPALAEVVGRPGLHVLRLSTDRARNVALHQAVAAAVQGAVAALRRDEPGADAAAAPEPLGREDRPA